MTLGTTIYTWFYGNFVGDDDNHNKYYCNKKDFQDKTAKRWVIYHDGIEASKIPPHWHAWLHKSVNEPPVNYKHKYFWQKGHKQNLTGTKDAYYPSSYPLSKNYNIEDKNEDYESWTP